MAHTPSEPVRRSKSQPRPRSCGGDGRSEIPVRSSMEMLPPEPSVASSQRPASAAGLPSELMSPRKKLGTVIKDPSPRGSPSPRYPEQRKRAAKDAVISLNLPRDFDEVDRSSPRLAIGFGGSFGGQRPGADAMRESTESAQSARSRQSEKLAPEQRTFITGLHLEMPPGGGGDEEEEEVEDEVGAGDKEPCSSPPEEGKGEGDRADGGEVDEEGEVQVDGVGESPPPEPPATPAEDELDRMREELMSDLASPVKIPDIPDRTPPLTPSGGPAAGAMRASVLSDAGNPMQSPRAERPRTPPAAEVLEEEVVEERPEPPSTPAEGDLDALRASVLSDAGNPMQSPASASAANPNPDSAEDELDALRRQVLADEAEGTALLHRSSPESAASPPFKRREGADDDLDALRASVLSDASNPMQSPTGQSLALPGGTFAYAGAANGAAAAKGGRDGTLSAEPSAASSAALLSPSSQGEGAGTGYNPMMTPTTNSEAVLSSPEPSVLASLDNLADDSRFSDVGGGLGGVDASSPRSSVGGAGGDGGDTDADFWEGVQAFQEISAAQDGRRDELNRYMVQLKEGRNDDGEQVVLFPEDFTALVHSLFHEKAEEKAGDLDFRRGGAGKDGEVGAGVGEEEEEEEAGPRRLSAAEKGKGAAEGPAGTKKEEEPVDPKVIDGLAKIHRLDRVLRKKAAEAYVIDRETFPDKWDGKQEQASDRATRILQQERKRRRRDARVKRALQGPGEDADAVARNAALGPLARYFTLQQVDEELVDAILARSDRDELANPFAPTGTAAELLGEDALPDGIDAETDMAERMAEIDDQLEFFTSEHQWDSQGRFSDYASSRRGSESTVGAPTILGEEGQLSPGSAAASGRAQSAASSRAPSVASTAASSAAAAHARMVGGPMIIGLPTVPESESGGGDGSEADGGSSSRKGGGKQQHPDYLAEQKEQRALADADAEIDRKLREFKTQTAFPSRLSPEEMAALVDDCRRQQEALSAYEEARSRAGSVVPPPSPPGARSEATAHVAGSEDGGGGATDRSGVGADAEAERGSAGDPTSPSSAASTPKGGAGGGAGEPRPRRSSSGRAKGGRPSSGRSEKGLLAEAKRAVAKSAKSLNGGGGAGSVGGGGGGSRPSSGSSSRPGSGRPPRPGSGTGAKGGGGGASVGANNFSGTRTLGAKTISASGP